MPAELGHSRHAETNSDSSVVVFVCVVLVREVPLLSKLAGEVRLPPMRGKPPPGMVVGQ